jgi:hypothetical protein
VHRDGDRTEPEALRGVPRAIAVIWVGAVVSLYLAVQFFGLHVLS